MQLITSQLKNFLKYLTAFHLFTFCLLAGNYGHAHTKVVVVPLGGHSPNSAIHVIHVAKHSGDFSDPVAAVNSITDADENNPYLIVIASGTYTLDSPLIMKEFVTVVGSGVNLTTLKGSFSAAPDIEAGRFSEDALASSALVQLANNSVLSNVNIVNTGHDEYTLGVYGSESNNTSRLDNVTITVKSSEVFPSRATGLKISGSPVISNTKIDVSSTWVGVGISASGSPFISEATLTVFSGVMGAGIAISSHTPSFASIVKSSFVISGGTGGPLAGVDCYECKLILSECTLNQSGGEGGLAFGVNQVGVSSVSIGHSAITSISDGQSGTTLRSLDDEAKTYVTQSTLRGNLFGDGSKHCIASDDGAGSTLNDDCTDPTPVL